MRVRPLLVWMVPPRVRLTDWTTFRTLAPLPACDETMVSVEELVLRWSEVEVDQSKTEALGHPVLDPLLLGWLVVLPVMLVAM